MARRRRRRRGSGPRTAKEPAPRATGPDLLDLEEVTRRLQQAIESSPADETELVWIEARRGEAASRGPRVDARSTRHRTLVARVLDHGRVGSHRTGFGDGGEVADAIRQAIAHSRANEPLAGLPHIPADESTPREVEPLRCPQLAELTTDGARELLAELRREREALDFDWTVGRVAVLNSRGVKRGAEVTSAALQIRRGRRPGGGRAATASRRLADLDGERLWEIADRRHAKGELGELPDGAVPAVLSGEAAIELVALLNRTSLTAGAYSDGTSFLREHLGVQVFDRAIGVRDDATDPRGLPFPFDLEGTAKRPVDLIEAGTPRTPALDQRQAAQLGLQPTGHSITGNDARAENLFLLPGDTTEEQLLEEADGGVWIGWLDAVAPIEPRRVRFLAHARGVRRIRDGRLAEALPDCIWDDSLLRCLSESPGVGRDLSRRLSRDGVLGGICAPPLRLTAQNLSPAPGP